ncbi:hypothetical protein CGRA01v4_04140 [Colletotrichum graminicola]|nr:hypothetical protein CGRA01v4_04140 [Colletotrichum graminicola]
MSTTRGNRKPHPALASIHPSVFPSSFSSWGSQASSKPPFFSPPPPDAIRSRNPFLLISLIFSSLLTTPTTPSLRAFFSASTALTWAARTALKSLTTPLCATLRSRLSVSIMSPVDTFSVSGATSTLRTRPRSIASFFCCRSCLRALASSARSTAARADSCASALRASTGSARFAVVSLVARILDMDVAKADGSLRLDFVLCGAPSPSSPLSSSDSESESVPAGASLLFFFFSFAAEGAGFVFFLGAGRSSAELTESSSSETAPSSTLALRMSSSSESTRFTASKLWSSSSEAGSACFLSCRFCFLDGGASRPSFFLFWVAVPAIVFQSPGKTIGVLIRGRRVWGI